MTELAAIALAGCIAIGASSDRITAGDLAAQFPGLESVSADSLVSLAPAPGVRRIFTIAELHRVAARWNATISPERDLCFERPIAPLDSARVLEAMRREIPEARIEILEYSRAGVPEGPIEFPAASLRGTSAGGFWTGSVRYGGTHRFLIWARVKVVVTAARVVSTEALKLGQPIDAASLRFETRDEFPSSEKFVDSLEQAAGKILRRPVSAGTALRTAWLESPKDVVRGDTVRVLVHSGAAVLELEARAETSGSVGQTVVVQNPDSKKRFPAKVQAPGRVTVGETR